MFVSSRLAAFRSAEGNSTCTVSMPQTYRIRNSLSCNSERGVCAIYRKAFLFCGGFMLSPLTRRASALTTSSWPLLLCFFQVQRSPERAALVLDLLLQQHDRVNQLFRTRGTAGHVNIHRNPDRKSVVERQRGDLG